MTRRFLKAKAWEKTERIAMGGGFRDSRIGELAIARANLILKADGIKVDMVPIHNDPDEAALIGSLFLAPLVDLQGTRQHPGDRHRRNEHPRRRRAAERLQGRDLTKASVWKSEKWRHADEEKLNREDAVGELIRMLKDLIKRAKKEGYQARAVHRHRAAPARSRKTARSPRARRTCPATGRAAASICRRASREAIPSDRRSRHHDPDAQRRRGAGPERGAVHAGREALGRAHHRHRARQRALHQPAERERARRRRIRCQVRTGVSSGSPFFIAR